MNKNDDVRSNVGCQNGVAASTRSTSSLQLRGSRSRPSDGPGPLSNDQVTGLPEPLADLGRLRGRVDNHARRDLYCYGSVLDNLTSDPTTVLPQ